MSDFAPCDEGLGCDGGECGDCGKEGEVCCVGDDAEALCGEGLACGVDGRCTACGSDGKMCCPDAEAPC